MRPDPSDGDSERAGSIAWPEVPEERITTAVAIAGVLAELSVQRLDVTDPRVCGRWAISARESDLPDRLMTAAPGTTFSGSGVALLIDEGQVRWVAHDAIAAGLREISAVA